RPPSSHLRMSLTRRPHSLWHAYANRGAGSIGGGRGHDQNLSRAVNPQYLRDILAPLPMLRLVPTGGIGSENAPAYLQAGAIAVGVGGNLVTPQAVARGDWDQITARARACVDAIRG